MPDHATCARRLLTRWWGKGLASEGTRELIRYAFEDLGLDRVFAETLAINVRSRRVMAAVGMTYLGTFNVPWDVVAHGGEQGEVAYELTRADWLGSRP